MGTEEFPSLQSSRGMNGSGKVEPGHYPVVVPVGQLWQEDMGFVGFGG